jgi:hypothetical protein
LPPAGAGRGATADVTESAGPPSKLLTGPDRIEYWPVIGRTVRMGAPSELAVSDVERVRSALRAGDAQRARSYLEHVHTLAQWMNSSWIEWSLTWSAFVEERISASEAERLTRLTYKTWFEGITTSQTRDSEEAEAVELAARLLASVEAGSEGLARFRRAERLGEPDQIRALHQSPRATHLEAISALKAGQFEDAGQAFEHYVRQSRSRHDVLAAFTWAYPSVVAREHGQPVAEEGIRRSLEMCSWFEDLWNLVPRLDPASLTALLAEELRAHFSGPGREGSVRIIEGPDRFRLIFEPCGSGQAMRQDAARGWSTGFGVFAGATAATWGRNGEVPAFCAHCAVNEMASQDRTGYRAWTTEFDPDPWKPCGWTIPKHRSSPS